MSVRIYNFDVFTLDFEEPFFERDRSSITEQAGYVDAETQVKRMLVAGVNLADYRKLSYEYGPDDSIADDVRPDPTMDVGFDLADASMIIDRAKATALALQKEGGKGETSPVSGVPSNLSDQSDTVVSP